MGCIISNFLDCVKNKYMAFDGRARRREYWLYTLVAIVINIILAILARFTAMMPIGGLIVYVLSLIITLGLFLPGLGVTVRRLHDIGKSGWWILLGFIPIVNLVLLYFLIVNSKPGSNEYGANPKGM